MALRVLGLTFNGSIGTISMSDPTVTVTLNRRELTLIRVGLLRRLDWMRENGLHNTPLYFETRSILNGPLWFAVTELREREIDAQKRL